MRITQAARDRYAAELAREGPAWSALAASIRAGFENLWITPALRAIEQALRDGPPEE